MSGALVIDITGFERLQERLRWIGNPPLDQLLDNVGSELVSQTELRIQNDKAAPDGTPWQEWTENYAKTRHGGQSLLVASNDLMKDIDYAVTTEGVEVGSHLVYAAIHQFGGEEVDIPIPARPYLGLSDENRSDIEELVNEFFRRGLK